jgi:hypothetical protein
MAKEIEAAGAEFFLDAGGIESGDQIDEEIRTALHGASELVVLLTPAALQRPYVWMEIGIAWSQDKRIVGILYGLTTKELAERDGTPAFIKGTLLRDINDFDLYLEELRKRVESG